MKKNDTYFRVTFEADDFKRFIDAKIDSKEKASPMDLVDLLKSKEYFDLVSKLISKQILEVVNGWVKEGNDQKFIQ